MSTRKNHLPRAAAITVLAAAVALAAPCGLDASTPPAAASLGAGGLPALAPLPEPALDGLDPAVAEPLRGLRQRVVDLGEELAADPGPDRRRAASEAYGDLGGLYLLYGVSGPAPRAALANARSLAPEDFRWPYLAGLLDQRDGALAEAAAGFAAALAIRPELVPALVHLGEVEFARGRLAEAQSAFSRALAAHANSAAARLGLGHVAAARGDAAAAIGHFEAALALQPDATEVHGLLAQALRALGREDEARAALARAGDGKVQVPDPVVQRLRGLATGAAALLAGAGKAFAEGDLDRAVAGYRAALAADPTHPAAHRGLGLALLRRGDGRGAVAAYREALRLEPANPLNHKDLGVALSALGDPTGAAAAFARAIELAPEFAEAHLGQGIALARLGRLPEALAALDRAVALDSGSTAARFERATVLAALDRRDDAVAALRELIAVAPGHLAARVNLAALLEDGGDLAGAREAATAALALEGVAAAPRLAAQARLLLGRVAERGGDGASAEAAYAEATRLDPALGLGWVRLGSVRGARGDLSGAAEAYRQAVDRLPGFPPARLALASALIRSGRCGDAGAALAGAAASPPVAATLALVLVGCPAGRDPARGLAHAREAYAAAPEPRWGEVLALALAATGQRDEAVRAENRLVEQFERAGRADRAAAARKRLAVYEQGGFPTEPWRDDPTLLPPLVVPLPGAT